MAPTSQQQNLPGPHNREDATFNGEEVVISGVSTVMPGCNNLKEFEDKLYGKVNMVSCGKSRWNRNYPELSRHNGTIPQVDRFDAQFFMVYHRLAHNMDAMTRKLLEHSYQAIFDAGISPTELSGKSVGVFIAAGICESEKACALSQLYLGIMGCNKTMFANRISYYLNLKGPSLQLDGDAAGAAVALEKAHMAIRTGQCEAVIVGAAKLLLHPETSVHYHKQIPMNQDGKVKCYDMNADSHSLSEGISVVFLQRYKDAKRVYASIRHVKTGFMEPKEEKLDLIATPYRNPAELVRFFKKFYAESNVCPSKVEYVEGFGSALPHADKAELEAIDEVFCKNRTTVLPVGSVTSNTGYTEAVSCLSSIVKLILAYNKGMIAANINCETPRQDVDGINTGRMRIVTEDAPFGRTLAAINNFSITGLNAHVLLQGHYKAKNISQLRSNSSIPYLLLISGRQESAVQRILDDVKGRPLDPEEITLLHNIHRIRIPKHLARGFGIYTTDEKEKTITLKEKVDYFDDAKRPLWFVYSGMGSQWAEMGAQLMRIPIFADAIKKCHKVLQPKGVDLIHIITAPDESLFDNILDCFVGIAAIQIGLTDILTAVGLVPDNIIGHSVGELGCAYADGCATAEEMILMAYSRGLVSKQTPFIRGSMAAVGLGFKQISKLIPSEIEVACHNGPDSSTVSGPVEDMKKFVAKLTAQGIFAKEVNCSNIAYHSRYIAEAGPKLLTYLKNVVKCPKARTDRWLSTSVPREAWAEAIAKYSSAEYHTNNLLSPVLFEETLKLVPHNAVLVEIAPHGLLQAILKRSLPETCTNISLTKRGHKDGTLFLLEAIGRLYMEGFEVNLSALYPKIEFPVSTETKPISHLVEWVYSEKFKVCQSINVDKKPTSVYKPVISVHDEEYEYLNGNVIEGKTVFPFSGVLVSVWETLAMTLGKQRDHLSIQFKDILLHCQPLLTCDTTLHLCVMLTRGSGRFEVTYEHGIIADGFVTAITNFTDLTKDLEYENVPMDLTKDDLYRILFERGYQYRNDFRSIQKANMDFTQADIIWNDNWVTFMDGLIQMNVLRSDNKGISQPRFIKRICIDAMAHIGHISDSKKNNTMDAVYSEYYNVTRCGGVVIEHVLFKNKPLISRQTIVMKEQKFVHYSQDLMDDIYTTLYVYLQIIAENLNKNNLNVYYIRESKELCILDEIKDLVNTPPNIKLNVISLKKCGKYYLENCVQPDVILLHEMRCDKMMLEDLKHIIPPNTFIVLIGSEFDDVASASLYRKIAQTGKGKDKIELCKWKSKKVTTTAAVTVRDEADLEHLKATKADLLGQHKLLIMATHPPLEGLKEMVQELREDNENVQVVIINKNYVDLDSIEFPSSDLVFNVFDQGAWGGQYYVPIKETQHAIKTAQLQINNFGDINSLTWVETSDSSKNCQEINVHYAGLNVYDAKRATAEISIKDNLNKTFGMDFSGISKSGERVMGLISGGAVSKVIAKPELLWPVPQHWTLEDAATIPLPYCLAFYCLTIKSRLARGMNVLIHGGAGALGQAAISICLANECNVLTTVSNIHKKRFLMKMFPDLPASHIGNSRDISFQDMVITATNGVGCHIIISSVAGELKKATLQCCATSGVTIDTTLIHSQENFVYGMFNMTRSRAYALIDFPSIFTHNNIEDMKLLQLMVSEGIARGYVRPLSRVTYLPEDVPSALRLLAASRHRGRVLINLQDPLPIAKSRMICPLDACYLILCDKDNEGFGIQIADRLIENGAKKLFIQTSNHSTYVEYKKLLWQKQGIQIQIYNDKLNKKDDVVQMLKVCMQWSPINGIFFVNTEDQDVFSKAKIKYFLTELDLASRELCFSLRYFAIIATSDLGNEVSMSRAQNGLPSLSLQLHHLEEYKSKQEINGENLNWRHAVDITERALLSNTSKVFVCALPLIRRSIMEELFEILGGNTRHFVDEEVTLQELGIDEGKDQELSNIIKRNLFIELPKEHLLGMSLLKFKSLEGDVLLTNKEYKGFDAYIKCIENDELMANCELVQMSSLVTTSDLVLGEIDNDQSFLCIVPGIESNYRRFHKLCERLKIAAVVLQPGFDVKDESVEEIAKRLVNIMLKKTNLQKHFFLLGYEFGILIAMEMAQILEKQGLRGTIYYIGGTPEEISATLNSQFSNINAEKLQDDLIEHIYTLITKNAANKLNIKIRDARDWDEKVEIFMKTIYGQCSYSKQYLRAFLDAIYKRILLARDYVLEHRPLKSKVVILKAVLTELTLKATSSSNDYHAIVHQLNGSLADALDDLRCSPIVNKYLDQAILDIFKNLNLCETALEDINQKFVIDFIDIDSD